MNLDRFEIATTGDKLVGMINDPTIQRKMIAEGFLYEKTRLMIAADPGCGKSTIVRQAIMELAAGVALFGYFHVPEPVKVYYIQAERDILETIEHMKAMSNTIPLKAENIFVTSEFQVLNLLKEEHVNTMVEVIKRDCPDPDVVVIDPIYATIPGGLKEDKEASMFNHAIKAISNEFDCAIWLNHHTTKSKKEADGTEKNDPFFGSQWLKAAITGSYYMKESDLGVTLLNKKDNYRLLMEKVDLLYDPDIQICYASNTTNMLAIDRLMHFLMLREVDQKEFDFKTIQDAIQVSTSKLRELLLDTRVTNRLDFRKVEKNKKLYKVKVGN